MEIIDDFIPLKEQLELFKYVSDSKFPYRIFKTHIEEDAVTKPGFHSPDQFTHHLYFTGEENSSPHLGIIRPIFDRLNKMFPNTTLLRAKVNLTTPAPPYRNYEPQIPHVDMKYDNGDPVPHMVCLYYINNTDGPTYFFDKNERIIKGIQPKQGRAIIFSGDKLHAGSNPVHYPYRFALNINFQKASQRGWQNPPNN